MNYTDWSLVMKVNLWAAGLYDIIESNVGNYHDERSALTAILYVRPLKMQVGSVVKIMTHEAWETIRKVHVSINCVKEANVEQLHQEFGDIAFKAGKMVEDFALSLNTMANQLRVLGDDISDKEVIGQMLHTIPEKVKQVTISMETLLDLGSLSIEEAIRHLCVVEQQKKSSPTKESDDHLLLMEEWMAHMKSQDGSGSNSGAHRGSASGDNDKNRGGKWSAGGVKAVGPM
jgi:hypothetical protein